MQKSNQRWRSITKFNNNKELLEAAIWRYTSKQKLKQPQRSSFRSKTEDCRPDTPLKMKSFKVFFKDLDPKFVTVNYETDICTIVIEQNTFYSMAISEVVEIYIQENIQQEIYIRKQLIRADLEKDTLKI